jgi:hypothetical protein
MHFYQAMSHEMMAREATWKHRSAELSLAEEQYLAALSALLTYPSQKLDNVPEQSPTSPTSEDDDLPIKGRRVSDSSQQSTASSSSSVVYEDAESTSKTSSAYLQISARADYVRDQHFAPPRTSPAKPSELVKSRHTQINAANAARFYREEQFSADLTSFIDMIKLHLSNVVELKETTNAPTLRYTLTRSRSSTLSSRPISSQSSSSHESEVEGTRWPRKTLTFRPRFDPASVRKLCDEVLAELSGTL